MVDREVHPVEVGIVHGCRNGLDARQVHALVGEATEPPVSTRHRTCEPAASRTLSRIDPSAR